MRVRKLPKINFSGIDKSLFSTNTTMSSKVISIKKKTANFKEN